MTQNKSPKICLFCKEEFCCGWHRSDGTFVCNPCAKKERIKIEIKDIYE